MNNDQANNKNSFLALGVFLVFALLIGAAGYALFHHLKEIEKTGTHNNLAGIGQLKVGQIQAYFQDRKGDALVLSKVMGLPLVQRGLANPSTSTVPFLRLETRWDPYRADPRFQALLAKYADPRL